MKHKFRVAAINDGYCMRCGNSCHDSIHKIDLNPSDEKLREMIAEKDAEIARLKAVKNCYYECVGKDDANQRIAEAQEKAIETVGPVLAEKDAEIASLRKSSDTAQDTVQRQWETIQLLQRDAERYRKFKSYADQSQNQTAWGWSVDFPYADDSIEFDDAIDALPEAK